MRSPTPPEQGSANAPEADARVRQRERFVWFAERMQRWVGYYQVRELRRFASGSAAWPGQREKALVLLALTDSEKASKALESLDVEDEDESFRILHEIALSYARSRD